MTLPSDRGVPVRGDMWRPEDELLNSVIRKSIDDYYRRTPGTGSSPVLAAGALVLAAFALVVAVGTGSPMLALGIAVLMALAGVIYIGMKAAPLKVDRLQILSVVGGPGNLPAGYLVYPDAWKAGMPEYLAAVSNRHLRVAVRLCREHPGSVSDLLRLVRRAEKQFVTLHSGKEPMESELYRVAARMTMEHAALAPALS
ncbi:hypothetical protein AB0F81_15860 [Actinoplanes sp. NPDC024001]|uniref:hypothetical protein n=1 Tax=Actinoplanes sp. NPDC024001 TaxID=3154598 RepID=UPI0033CEEA6D